MRRLLLAVVFVSISNAYAQFGQSFESHDQSNGFSDQGLPSAGVGNTNGYTQANIFSQQGTYQGTVTTQAVGGNTVNIINQNGSVTTSTVNDSRMPGMIGGGVYFTPVK